MKGPVAVSPVVPKPKVFDNPVENELEELSRAGGLGLRTPQVDLTDGTAVVPAGRTDEETQASLWKAMFALFSANASLSAKMSFRSQEGMVIGRRAMEAANISPVRRTTYKVACEEGWAPPPTNDFQRAIWDATKAATNAPAATPPAK